MTVTCTHVRQDPGDTVAAGLSTDTNPPLTHIAQPEREISNARSGQERRESAPGSRDRGPDCSQPWLPVDSPGGASPLPAGPSARGCQAGVMRQVHPSDPGAPPVDHNPQKISGCCRTASTCQREAGGCCRGRGGRCVAWFSCLSWRSRGWCPGGSICHREVPPHITPTGSLSSPRPHAPGHLPKPSHGGLYTNSHQK